VDEVAGAVEDELDDFVFSRNGEPLEQIVGYYLQMRNATVSVAESCTGGLLAERITSISGSSRYFVGGAVVYSNELKTELAGVPAAMIEKHGGPAGGSPEKPVGLVFHSLASNSGTEVVERQFPGDRKLIRRFATQMALDMVRRKLM
jgi:nicotinamide-nucleotide amidase